MAALEFGRNAMTTELVVKCSMFLEYDSVEEAQKIAASLEADNEGFIETRQMGSVVKASTHAESLKSLLHTINDYMACLSTAEELLKK